MNKHILEDWNHTVAFLAIDLLNFDVLTDTPELADTLYCHIKNIFTLLAKLRTQKIYTDKEINTIFSLIKDDVYGINEIFVFINQPTLPSLVYEIIYNITEELILLLEDHEVFEGCANLLAVRKFWFGLMLIKIHNQVDVEK